MMLNTYKKVHIELTSRCRLACKKCDRVSAQERGTLTIDDIDVRIIEKYSYKDFDCFVFCGNLGDPIYHPRFFEIIEILKNKNKSIEIHTNGSGKTESWWRHLYSMLDDKDTIWFSMDGLEDTCGIYRVNFTAKDYKKNIEMMKISKQYEVNVNWMFIAFSFNQHQIEQARQIANDIGINFCLRKSSRWKSNDQLLPSSNLISTSSIL